MTTVRDILAGKYCENCASDCAKWDMKENCCRADNIAGRLYAMAIPELLDREMKYETRAI